MNKIVITGPESSGKTTLFSSLQEEYDTCGVEEYARVYIDQLETGYGYNDILEIAKGQIENEKKAAEKDCLFMLADTDLLTLEVWCEYKYQKCHHFIKSNLRKMLPDYYLLCYPDIPWEYDPQRENPNDRVELFEIYRAKIVSLGVDYQIVKGGYVARLKNSKSIINHITNS